MALREKYLAMAAQCVSIAERSASDAARTHFLDMADTWRALARDTKRIEARVNEARELGVVPETSKPPRSPRRTVGR